MVGHGVGHCADFKLALGGAYFPAEVAVVNGFVAVYEKPHFRAVVDERRVRPYARGERGVAHGQPLVFVFFAQIRGVQPPPPVELQVDVAGIPAEIRPEYGAVLAALSDFVGVYPAAYRPAAFRHRGAHGIPEVAHARFLAEGERAAVFALRLFRRGIRYSGDLGAVEGDVGLKPFVERGVKAQGAFVSGGEQRAGKRESCGKNCGL